MSWEGSPAVLAKVAPPLAAAVLAMAADPAVKTIGLTSGWRSYDQQVAARKANGCPDIMNSPAKACRVPTARPGTSNHEATLKDGTPYALAVDLHGDLAGAAKVMGKYGLHRPVTGESWHFELVNTDTLKATVRAGATPSKSNDVLNLPATDNLPATPVVVSPIGSSTPAGSAVNLAERLGDGSLWARVAMWAGGLTLAIVGLVVVSRDASGPGEIVQALT